MKGKRKMQLKGLIYTERFCFEPGILCVEEDRIQKIEIGALEDLTEAEQGTYLLPGLVDIHFHGCAGYDFSDGNVEAISRIADFELQNGITSICPATMTLAEEQLVQICRAARESQVESLQGIYLEGPFLSYEKCGAQNPAYIRKPDVKFLDKLQQEAGGLIKIVAIAPEEEGAMECIQAGKERYRFSIAHTCADYDIARKAIEAGAEHVTHLYNAMPPFTHRAPGVIGAAAEQNKAEVELICDGVHIHPSVVRNTFQWFGAERVILISDSMMAAGMVDGMYSLGGQKVEVQGNLARLENGTIAGSVTHLYDCMKKAVEMGVPKEAAVRAASYNPAKSIGIERDYGVLGVGKKADILVTDRNFSLQKVYKSGQAVMPG